MNILIFDEASWDDRNSFGNTVSNFFCGKAWNDDNFCNFYARKKKWRFIRKTWQLFLNAWRRPVKN